MPGPIENRDASPPMTADYILFHAARRPDAIALVENGRGITYAAFRRDLARITQALGDLGLVRGSFVAVECGELYLHWLLLLACEAHGVATGSYLHTEGDGAPALLAHVELVICEHVPPAATSARIFSITLPWLSAALARDEQPDASAPPSRLALGEPLRLRRSSGTTGGAKTMVVRRGAEEKFIADAQAQGGYTGRSRLLITQFFTSFSLYARATACLRLGATCIFDTASSLAGALVAHRPSHVMLFPFQMKLVLDELPPDFPKPTGLVVGVGGGALSPALRQQARNRLSDEILDHYGTNECGLIAMMDASYVGTVCPGVMVEIVDANDAPVPIGEAGEIRIRTQAMIDAYLGNPEATRRMFRNGWFHPGDTGIMPAPGRVRITGRVDDLIQIAGLKLEPTAVEEKILSSVPGLAEIAVTATPDSGIGLELGFVVVLSGAATLEAVAERLACALPPQVKIRILATDKLPRTAAGKVQRHLLKGLFR